MTVLVKYCSIYLDNEKLYRNNNKKRKMGRIMKSTGIVRKIDTLGRVVLPIELRRVFDIDKEDPVEIFVDDNYIMLKKYQPACIFCNDAKDVVNFRGKNICHSCLDDMKTKQF